MKVLYWTIFFLLFGSSAGWSLGKGNTNKEVPDTPATTKRKIAVIKKTELKSLLDSVNKKHQTYSLINRYERINLASSNKNQNQLKIELTRDVRPTVRVIDKPLVLGENGFNDVSFEADDYKLHFTFNSHLRPPNIFGNEKQDSSYLDPSLEKIQSKKFLIFHHSSSIFSHEVDLPEKSKLEQPLRQKKAYTKVEVPPSSWIFLEAHVKDFQNKATSLHLLPASKPLDLIYDNPAILKRNYQILNSGGS